MRVIKYEKILNSAVSVADRLTIEVSPDESESLKDALKVISEFEAVVSSSFMESRGYSPSDSRYSDNFKEIHFWFKDGFVLASIRAGSVG